jgi:metallo-beta-lactamase class B
VNLYSIAITFCLSVVLVNCQRVAGQTADDSSRSSRANHPLRGAGSQPAEPFRVIGNVYYVGAVAISSYVIATDDGLILLDTGTKEMAPGIRAGIAKLGFDLQDIKIILSSHAHWDHVEGHAAMKEATDAKVMALGEDAAAITSGVDNSAIGAAGWTPTQVDRVLEDGDTVTLGGVTIRAHLTAGHTKGCTTWTMTVQEGDQQSQVVFVGGTSINPGVRLLKNTRHPRIAEDYARTFRVLKELRADVFLAQHPTMYEMAEKFQRMTADSRRNPFIDPEGYQRFVRDEERKFVAQLQDESVQQ